MLASKLFLDKSRVSNFSCSRERMHAFGGTAMEASCGVWWIGSTALGNGDVFSPPDIGR